MTQPVAGAAMRAGARRAGAAAGLVAVLVAAVVPTPTGATAETSSPNECPSDFNPPAPLSDRASTSDAHVRNVDCGYNHGLVRGFGDGSYRPHEAVRRDQMASFLAGMLEAAGHRLPEASHQGFSDLAGSAHRDRINQLAEIGVVTGAPISEPTGMGALKGTGDRVYRPREPVSRGQMAAFLLRAAAWTAGAEAEDLYGDPDATPFADVDGRLAHGPAIAGAYAAGLVRGRTEASYAPHADVARQQMATFVVRAFGAVLVDAPEVVDDGDFRGSARPLPAPLRARMAGVSWRPGCPVALDDLALLEMTHRRFDGGAAVGEMVVEARLADDVLGAFERIYAARFPIEGMRLIEDYAGSDDRSMADNNTSAFNCRAITGGGRFSEHAYGRAIDINPVQNPYVRGGDVQPPDGSAYLNRGNVRPGMIVRPGPVTDAFGRIGWGWGGDWRTLSDYMHFSESGR